MNRPSFKLIFLGFLSVSLPLGADVNKHHDIPAAVVDKTSIVFTTVQRGETISEIFAVRNVGGIPLIIEKVEFSRPGMKIKVKQTIAAGESTEAIISWDTHRISGDVEGEVLLYLNDPLQPQILLTLSGRIQAPISVVPRPAFYISQFAGEQTEKSVLIQNNQDKIVKITRIEPLGDHFTANVQEEKPGKTFRLTVKVAKETKPGRYREALLAHTDDEHNPNIHIEVNILVKADVFVIPEDLDFGRLSKSELTANPALLEFTEQIVVITRREGAMKITSIESDLQFLTTQIEPTTAAQRFRLDVAIDPKNQPLGPISGMLTLLTSDPEFPQIKIPVKGFVTE